MKKLIVAVVVLGMLSVGYLWATQNENSSGSLINEDNRDNQLKQGCDGPMTDKIEKTEEDWRRDLTPEQYHIMREKGTERAFTGEYNDFKSEGIFLCAACGHELFSSEHKYNSGSGWPSYWKPLREENIETQADSGFGMIRIEVKCARCGSHLGHVFDDGPQPTGLRYCINSAALEFKGDEDK